MPEKVNIKFGTSISWKVWDQSETSWLVTISKNKRAAIHYFVIGDYLASIPQFDWHSYFLVWLTDHEELDHKECVLMRPELNTSLYLFESK